MFSGEGSSSVQLKALTFHVAAGVTNGMGSPPSIVLGDVKIEAAYPDF